MNLRRLSEFLAVVQQGSIGAAADVMDMTQPGLSKSIGRLEKELGVRLLERLPRGVRSTIYGELLKEYALRVKLETEHTLAEIRSVSEGLSGKVTVGAGADWLFSVVPRAARALRLASPKIRIAVLSGFNDELQAMLLKREVDFCLATLPPVDFDTKLRFEIWIKDRFHVVARREHPIHRRKNLKLESLLEYPWALPASSTLLRQSLDEVFIAQDLPVPMPGLETNYMPLNLIALAKDDYLGWVTELQLKRAQDLNLVPVDLKAPPISRRAGLITRRGETLAPAARSFIHALKDACREELGGISQLAAS